MNELVPFNSLLGKTILSIDGLSVGSDVVVFRCRDGSEYQMHHRQDCCESVSIEDICGDPDDILFFPVLQAEEATSSENPPGAKTEEYQDSFTWTFYRLTTNRGQIVIRWYGESNGYYSESVDFVQTKEITTPPMPPAPAPAPAPETKKIDLAAYRNYLDNMFNSFKQ